MRSYETMIVFSALLGDETTALRERFVSVVKDNGGTVDAELDWGVRKLAYPILDQSDGRVIPLELERHHGLHSERHHEGERREEESWVDERGDDLLASGFAELEIAHIGL